MKRLIIFILTALTLCNAPLNAQTDARNRTAETIIADALAQLPTNNHATMTRVMGEIAATGNQGVAQIAKQLTPPEQGKCSVQEYAISGLVDYVTSNEGETYRNEVRKGLVRAFERCLYARHRVFLLTQLARCATPEDLPLFMACLEDKQVADCALASMAAMPGMDKTIAETLSTSSAPKASLAKIIEARKLEGCEDLLTEWTTNADTETLRAIYSALARTGTEKSIGLLAGAAEKASYRPEATHAANAYATLLDRMAGTNKEEARKGAKAFMASGNTAMRCAGLRLWLKTEGENGTKTVVRTLGENNAQMRNTALDCGAEFCGKGVFKAVSNAFRKLPQKAQVDVVRWYGDNHAAEGIGNITRAIDKGKGELLAEAIKAASKIGGEKALEALIGQLGKTNGADAAKALMSFNGNINAGITQALSSKNRNVVMNALPIASARHIHEAYDKVIELAQSDDKELGAKAYDALGGVATAGNFADLCALLNQSGGADMTKIQKAAMEAIKTESGDKQYEMVEKAMNASRTPERYYPLMAQAGTGKAIELLKNEHNDEATKAMLSVDNTDMLPVLAELAKAEEPGEKRDKILSRYLTLADKAQVNPTERYLLLSAGDELHPTESLRNRFISSIGKTHTLQSLSYMRKYYDTPAHIDAVAERVKETVAQNSDLNGGKNVTAMLHIAKSAYADKQIEDADAGYAVDQIKGLMEKTADTGYVMSTEQTKMGKRGFWTIKDKFENFNLSFDWKTKDFLTVKLRSMPILTFDNSKGVKIAGSDEWKTYKSMGDWNTADIKVVDDRMSVTVNGHEIFVNTVMNNPEKDQSLNATGHIGFCGGSDSLTVRYTRIRKLPSTPVYVLSPEESRQGYEMLFDGRSLDKWQGNTVNYVPQNGNINVTADYGGSGNLYTKKEYSDFVLRFEFCFDRPGVNNGIGVRTNIGTDAAYDGMEIQILDHDDPIYKGLQPYQQHGAVYGVIVPERVKFDKTGTWNTEEIRVAGDNITVTVNGKVILKGNIRKACKGHNVAPDGSDKNPYTVDKKNHPGLFNKRGHISLCGHGAGIKFRNIRILDLEKKNSRNRN